MKTENTNKEILSQEEGPNQKKTYTQKRNKC